MSPLQFLPQLKRWVSLEGFYDKYEHVSYRGVVISKSGEHALKNIIAVGKILGEWQDQHIEKDEVDGLYG